MFVGTHVKGFYGLAVLKAQLMHRDAGFCGADAEEH
jgi:hypothetical protein